MRKLSLAAAGLTLSALMSLPGTALAQAPTRDSVVGSGSALLTGFDASVHAGPGGENPTGFLTVGGFLNFTATPTCLNVSGSAAVVGFRRNDINQGFLVSVVDNGPPVGGQPVDAIAYSGLLPVPPANCPAPGDPPPPELSATGGGPLLTGDIRVVDAPSLPTSKDQCKKRGWQTFGIFRNQGDCVSSVARRGRTPKR